MTDATDDLLEDLDASLDDSLDAPGLLPNVVAVVVTHDPGAWFEECFAAVVAQDYPAYSVLVIDTASKADPTPRVAAMAPQAYVRRLSDNPGWSKAANETLELVEGATFLLFCHDDVAPAPDAVRLLVEEAFRSNAGIVSPKLVQFDDVSHLLQVGLSADKLGEPVALVDRGELDQEQHDAVRDVFVAPGAACLVRTDLFRALGGYDPEIHLLGDDVDLCWRAQVAGARVIVAPAAVARHVEALGERREVDDRRRLQARHRLRTMLTCYGPVHLLRVLPQAVVLLVAEAIYALAAGHRSQAADALDSLRWNAARLSQIRANRARLKAYRRVPDSEVRRLQMGGSARLVAFLRGQIGRDMDDRLSAFGASSRNFTGSFATTSRRVEMSFWVATFAVVAFGSRLLLLGTIGSFGELATFPARPWTLLDMWHSSHNVAGGGSDAAVATVFALLGAAGTLLVGSISLLRRALLIVPLITGGVGAHRLLGADGSRRARLVATIAYMAMPLPYNAIARGRVGGLVVWAAAPWVLRSLARAVNREPFTSASSWRQRVLGTGLGLAVVGAFVPVALLAVVVVAAALAAGGVLAGRRGGGTRALALALSAGLLGLLLNLPWTIDLVRPSANWSAVGGLTSRSGALSLGALLRFQDGPLGAGVLGYMFVMAALLPLVIGRDWRREWACRAWMVALACWAMAWLGQQSWWAYGFGPPEVLLAPASAALALCLALGLMAFETDLRGYRFGIRQVLSLAAAGALTLGTVPVFAASFDGKWGFPDQGYDQVLDFLAADRATAGPSRVLWIGDPDVLPVQGWHLAEGSAFGVSAGPVPAIADRFTGSAPASARRAGDALRLAAGRRTARLGRLLVPLGIRYVIVTSAAAPFSDEVRPPPPDIVRVLGDQLDLASVPVDPTLRVYRNAAWDRAVAAPSFPTDPTHASAGRLAAISAQTLAWLWVSFVLLRRWRRERKVGA